MESPRAVPSPRAAGVKRKGSLLEAANGAKALRPASTDNVKREKVEEMLQKALAVKEDGAEEEGRQLIRQRASEIEEALYSVCRGCTTEYSEKVKTLKFNIANNKELRQDILSEDITADALVAMKSADLADREKKSLREAAKAESLQETINNDELKNLKEAAAGLMMRKTDAGLAVVDLAAEKAKKEEEELSARKLEEESKREAAAASKKQLQAMVRVDTTDEAHEAYLKSQWVYTPKSRGEGHEDSDDEDATKNTELVFESKVDENSQEELFEVADEDEEPDKDVVWDGELDCSGGKKKNVLYSEQIGSRPLHLKAYPLQEEGELHNRIFERLQVKGYIPLAGMESYIEAKRKTPESKMVLAYKMVPRRGSRPQYDTLVEQLNTHGKGMCLIDDRNWGGILYCLPSSSKSVTSLLPFTQEDCLVAVAITDKKIREPAPKRQQPDEITQDLTNDLAKAKNEKTVLLHLKKGSCTMRLRTIAGDVELANIPEELKDLSKGHVGDVIDFLLTQKVSVMEVEPEGDQDQEEYVKLMETLMEKKRAAVVLDTEKALMYIVPPVEDAGKLLDPPSSTCDSMLGVLLLSAQSDDATLAEPQDAFVNAVQPEQNEVVAITKNPASNKSDSSHFPDISVAQQPESAASSSARNLQQSSDSNLHAVHRHTRAPAPFNVRQAPVSEQQQPFDPSPRPAYDPPNPAFQNLNPSMSSPRPPPISAPGEHPSRQLPPVSANGPHVARTDGWGMNQQRGHDERGGGWRNESSFYSQGTSYIGDGNANNRQWRPAPQNAPSSFGMHGGQHVTSSYERGGIGGMPFHPGQHAGPPSMRDDFRGQRMGGVTMGPMQGGGQVNRLSPNNNMPFNNWGPGPNRGNHMRDFGPNQGHNRAPGGHNLRDPRQFRR